MFTSLLYNVNKVVFLPYFIASLFGIIVIFKKTKKSGSYILLTIFFMALVRYFYSLNNPMSSRYYLAFVVPCVIFSSLAISFFFELNKRIAQLILMVIVLLNSVLVFNAKNDKYVFLICDALSFYHSNKEYHMFIESKEINRFVYRILNQSKLDAIRSEDFEKTIKENMFNQHELLFVTRGDLIRSSIMSELANEHASVKYLSFIHSSKTITSLISIYTPSTIVDQKDVTYNSYNNLIYNGDVEMLFDAREIHQFFDKWIKSGITYYNDVLFPKSYLLLSTWKNPTINFPKVFADPSLAIDGRYSLHIIAYNYNDKIYLFNKINSVEGDLVFYIKSVTPESRICLSKADFDNNNEWITDDNKKVFKIVQTDSKIHKYSVHYNEDDFKGKNFVFCISVEDSDFLIDDIQYIPTSRQ